MGMRLAVCVGMVTALATSQARALADETGRALLVPFEELQGRLGSENLRLIDARPKAAYEKGHIPGAIHVDPKEVEAIAKRPGALEDRELWAGWIKPLGVRPGMTVLVYDANKQLDAARLWWLLTYLGVEQAGLVDGNFGLWAEEGRPVETADVAVEPSAFPVELHEDRHASRDEVLASLGDRSAQVLDARSAAENAGERVMSKRGGHIPGACHLEWTNMVDAKGRFLPLEELREKVKRAGIREGVPVVSHCQGGGRASVNAFVLERLGFPTRNYYLGWSDWGNVEETPVETGAPGTKGGTP